MSAQASVAEAVPSLDAQPHPAESVALRPDGVLAADKAPSSGAVPSVVTSSAYAADVSRAAEPTKTVARSVRKPYDPFKRILDVVGAVLGLVLLLPVIAIVAVLVRAKLGSPVLFKQDRPGLHGTIFKLYKFRSMLDVDESKSLVSDAERLTSFGKVLRSTSLDELPTLVNVLRGDMSVVGPRPLLVEYLPRYSLEQARRHEVRPGVTGLAQVRGRNAISWARKFEFDVEYVDRRSLRLDAQILFETARAVLVREGITAEGHATISKFQGTARVG